MPQATAGQKFGIAVRILGQMAGRRASQSRVGGALLSGARAAAATFGRVLHILWLEVTGFVFLAIAVIGGFAAEREYHKYIAGQVGETRLATAILFTLLFVWFGISSFWRAKRK